MKPNKNFGQSANASPNMQSLSGNFEGIENRGLGDLNDPSMRRNEFDNSGRY